METYSARLASFNTVHPATKKRPSDPKGSRKLKWPHKRPAPPQLAQAGFFYAPTSSCPDNVRCYLCKSSLDGWEETDDPIDEHLSHCGHCGWAIAVATDRAIEGGNNELKDPSSEEMLDARKMTFAGWPHENKRGWLCKTQKMVEAGWHYCPTPESDDFARCSYCSLSLDGWEPKDNPFQEHQRRSPDCIFFQARVEDKPKASKGRRGRASKISRMSTQSNATLASEAPSLMESELNGDESSLSAIPIPRPKMTKGSGKGASKKGPKKSKASQKQVEEPPNASAYLEPEDDDFSIKVDPSPEIEPRGKKRKSEDAGQMDEAKNEREAASEAPPAKRRATRTRSSVVIDQSGHEASQPPKDEDVDMTDAEKSVASSAPVSKQGRQGGKERASSSTRKASKLSTASQASLRSAIPRDEDIDAALALDLDRPLTDDEEIEVEEDVKPKTRRLTRTKPGSQKSTASRAPTRKANRASSAQPDESIIIVGVTQSKRFEEAHDDDHAPIEEDTSPGDGFSTEKAAQKPLPRNRATKQKVFGKQNDNEHELDREQEPAEEKRTHRKSPPLPKQTRQVSRQLPARSTKMSAISTNQEAEAQRLDSSTLDSQRLGDDSGHETDASVVTPSHGIPKIRTKGPAKKGTKGKKAKPANGTIEEIVQPPNDPADDQDAVVDGMLEVSAQENDKQAEAPDEPKGKKVSKARAAPKTGKAKKGASKSKAPVKEVTEASLEHPNPSSPPHVREASPESPAEMSSAPAVAGPPTPPLAQTTQSTPAASPQSSDAENHPPSSRPSEVRPPLAVQSPTKSQMTRIPLAISTPTRSPVKNTFSKLQTSVPWTMTDLELVFQPTPGQEKEYNPYDLGIDAVKGGLTSPEKKMTVEQWIQFNAQRGEEKFRSDCERTVNKFEAEGMRAMKTLEGIECAE